MLRFYKLSRTAVLASPLIWAAAAHASFVIIAQPNAAYTSSTTLIPITGNDFDTTTSLSDANLTVTFSTLMEKFSVPTTWTSWSSPPDAETSTPNVLSPADISVNSVMLNFSTALSTFGIEVEPDALPQYGTFPVSLTFFNGATQIGQINKNLDGATSALFAASVDGATPLITSVVLTVAPNVQSPHGTDPGMAQFRYALASVSSTPEPATLFTCGSLLAVLFGLRSRRARK